MRRLLLTALLVAAADLVQGPACAQQVEKNPRPAGEHWSGYLPPASVDFRALLPSPPVAESVVDRLDVAATQALQSVGADRWKIAEADDALIYPRFEDAFGAPIDRVRAPQLTRLLNRSLRDASAPTFAAKAVFLRLRPYQRFQLARVCGEAAAPAPDPSATERSSYPSGHSAYGWTVGLILAQVAPDHADAVLDRARDYGLSRVVCGVHFMSDVEAGRVMAQAVVTRLTADPGFQRDLACARAEHAGVALPPTCAAFSAG